MRRQGLLTRLGRLERQSRARSWPHVVFAIFDKSDSEATAVDADGVIFDRQLGEPLAALYQRAFAATGAWSAATIYAEPERDNEPSRHRAPANESDGPPTAIPGVGRIATRDQLIRMGVITVPPERVV